MGYILLISPTDAITFDPSTSFQRDIQAFLQASLGLDTGRATGHWWWLIQWWEKIGKGEIQLGGETSKKTCFHSYLGKIPIWLYNIFQMGWNHQVDNFWWQLFLANLAPKHSSQFYFVVSTFFFKAFITDIEDDISIQFETCTPNIL